MMNGATPICVLGCLHNHTPHWALSSTPKHFHPLWVLLTKPHFHPLPALVFKWLLPPPHKWVLLWLCSILIVNRLCSVTDAKCKPNHIRHPSLHKNLDIKDLQCHKDCPLPSDISSKFQLSMTYMVGWNICQNAFQYPAFGMTRLANFVTYKKCR